MTEITFYILEDTTADAADRFICRLADKILTGGHRAYVHVADADRGSRLDGLMWTFKQNSFVPHACVDNLDAGDDRTPILIGHAEPPPAMNDVLVGAGGDVSRFFSRFSRHNEIVTPQARDQARERYRFYKDRGYEINTHRIAAS